MRTLLAAVAFSLSFSSIAAPTVSLSAPANGNLYLAPGTFAVKANASASGVGVNRVEFYANGALIQTDTTSPYQFDWTGVAAGTYALSAKAIDNNGAETTSATRTVTVAATNTPPTVSLSAPADNARYLNPTSVTLSPPPQALSSTTSSSGSTFTSTAPSPAPTPSSPGASPPPA